MKSPPANARDPGSVPESGRSSGIGNGSPLQYSCLENPMDRGAWWAAVRGVAKSRMRLSMHTHACMHPCSPHSEQPTVEEQFKASQLQIQFLQLTVE